MGNNLEINSIWIDELDNAYQIIDQFKDNNTEFVVLERIKRIESPRIITTKELLNKFIIQIENNI